MKEIKHIPTGYKPSPLGIIPEDWKVKRIGDFGKVITGNTPPTEDADNYGDVYKFVSPADISDNKYIETTEKHLSEKGFSISRQMPKGTVLFTCIGSTIGKCAIANEALTSNQQINAIICDSKHCGEFLYYELSHRSNRIKQIAGEQAVPIINKSTFENYKVLCPPFEEQKRICDILSLWDTAIAKQTQLIEKLTLRKKGLMQQLITGKKRLKGFEGDSFKLTPFDKIAKIVNVKAFQINKTDYQEAGKNPVVDQGQLFVAAYSDSDKVFKDVPFVLFGDHTRIIKWIDFPCVIGADGVQAIKSKEIMDIKYLYYLLSNIELPNLGYSRHMSILKEKVFYVTTDIIEQKAISKCLSNADKEIEIQKQKLEQLQSQKRGLMQVLLTGKRRVK